MKKAAQDKDGNPIVMDMTPGEVSDLIDEFIQIWHFDRPIQLLIGYEQNAKLMQSDYGVDMLNYFKSINPPDSQ